MEYTRGDLAKYENLELAWTRIQTGSNYSYKYLCEKIFTAFSWNLSKNLSLLSREIEDRVYKPSKASKYYLPKESGLVRPITVLSVKDQIYYQAIVNLICKNKLDDINKFRYKNVFGGFNIKEPSGRFFLSKWQDEYKLYQESIIENFENGNIWLAKFDLASFYDVIDHKLLVEFAASLEKTLQEDFFKALECWTQPQNVDFFHSQGIPQGPLASVVLADIYLHLLDQRINRLSIKEQIKYLRYVDDIIVMGKEEKSIQKGLVQLDITARELSLIPQSGKTLIKRIENIEDELKGRGSLFEFLEIDDGDRSLKMQKKLKELFLESVKPIEENKIQVLNETNVKFALYRLLPDPDITDFVLRIIKSYSHLTDICVTYLKQSQLNRLTSRQIVEHIQTEPNHDWHTAQLIQLLEVLHQSQRRKLQTILPQLLLEPNKHWILKKSLVETAKNLESMPSLIEDELTDGLDKPDIEKKLPYYISMLAASLELRAEATINNISDFNMVDDFCIFIGYYAKRYHVNLCLTLRDNLWIKNFFDEHDNSIDGISYKLVTLYDLEESYKNVIDFRKYFDDDEEYKQALEHICNASGFFEGHPEDFIQVTDVFNQILLAHIYKKDKVNIPPDELGNMINKLKKYIPKAFPGFYSCHELRCGIGKIHAYSQPTKKLNKKRTYFKERNKLKKELAIAYESILDYIKKNHIPSLD